LPPDWVWAQLDSVARIEMGQSPAGKNVSERRDGLEFHQGKISFTDKYILESGQYTSEITKIADINSLLLCVRAPVGIVNITQRKLCIGRGLCAIYPYDSIILTELLFYWLTSFQGWFEEQATGTTFKSITMDKVKSLIIPLPPLQEQMHILSVIKQANEIFSKIAENLN
jgi:type I restriction enzyme S subunit